MNISKDQIYNSTLATIAYMKNHNISKIYTLGTKEFNDELIGHGFEITENDPDLIVVAFDTSLTYQKLKKATLLIQNGIEYVATHPDKVCPTLEGFIPDTGSFIALLITATNKKPKHIFGKPNPNIITSLLDKYKVNPQDAIIFGDRIYTDIKMGKNCNLTTALMLTGESKIQDIIQYDINPDFIFKDLNETLTLMKSF
jgi:HAD superfamily hydrolase (TIGR01450 family)